MLLLYSTCLILLLLQLMRIANIATELKFANRIGQTLAAEERIGLEVSVLRLAQEYAC